MPYLHDLNLFTFSMNSVVNLVIHMMSTLLIVAPIIIGVLPLGQYFILLADKLKPLVEGKEMGKFQQKKDQQLNMITTIALNS